MNDRQRAIVDAATARVLAMVGDLISTREMDGIADVLYQLALDVLRPPARSGDAEPVRRMPAAGEVLPRSQRATWARQRTEYDD